MKKICEKPDAYISFNLLPEVLVKNLRLDKVQKFLMYHCKVRKNELHGMTWVTKHLHVKKGQ